LADLNNLFRDRALASASMGEDCKKPAVRRLADGKQPPFIAGPLAFMIKRK